MILAKIDENKIVLDVIVAELTDKLPEGNWVECPSWIGIGLSIDMPSPEPVTLQLEQPVTSGTQIL